ncbi:hypothetical protein F4780DRAFT_729593 [Xylariomycetidae sp. FL0641]|nr:hypothetical protein F4780DRAFT_729593 [Xylariomycetidae sp. FL0641]
MQFAAVSLSFFAALAAAQNSTSSASGSSSLPDLVSQLPQCATGCLSGAAEAAGCGTEDFKCICGSGKQKFISNIGSCAVLQCSSDDIQKASKLAPQICTAVNNNANDAAIASASSIVASAVSTSTPPSDTPGAAMRPEYGMGLLGAGVLAAIAL